MPLNEHAIRQLRDSATALDLYTWLAYRLPRINSKRPATISWQQLAVHFGNDGKNIRKFRQTVRDAWERQVSGVYPDARADFDTTVIRLHASPAPLQQRLVTGAHLRVATDENGSDQAIPVLASSTAAVDVSARFLAALTTDLGGTEARVWLRDVRLEYRDEEWTLLAPTKFVAHWIGTRFDQSLRRAAIAAALPSVPRVQARHARI